MALDRTNLVALMKQAAKANPSAPVKYSFEGKELSYEVLNETLRRELNELAGTYSLFRENKNYIYSMMEEFLDDVLPKKVSDRYDRFAEIKTVAQGDAIRFKRKLSGGNRAKQFITRVGLAGIYEVFKLGRNEESFEVRTSAIGGAAQVGLEEFLDGRVDFAELVNTVLDGMDELISREISASMKASINQLPPANKVIGNGFDENAFDQLVNIASFYGEPTIYCTYEFAVKMLPTEAWRYTEQMKEDLWNKGHFQTYKGKKVIILDQSVEDGSNARKVIDPGYAYIIPSGADEKPVKVVFEGNTIVDDFVNQDRSREIQVYKKVGVTTMLANNICAYVDTTLAGKMDTWALNNTDVKNVVYTSSL